MRLLVVALLVACGGSSKPAPTTAPVIGNERQTDQQLDDACNHDRAAACIELGVRYWDADGVDVDFKRAYGAFERACKQGNQEGCARAATAIAQDLVPGEMMVAYAMFDKACKANEKRGCRGLGFLKWQGKGTTKDIAGATELLTKLCVEADGASCGLLAVIQVNEQNNPDKARETAKRGCDLDASFACFVAAALVTDSQETYRLLAKACDLGDGEACTSYGATLLAGEDITRDEVKAVKILDRGCQLGAAKACRALGGALLAGAPGVVTDDAKAAKALLKSCDGGDLSGCAILGVAYATGRGVAKSSQRGIELMKKACDEGTTEATATGCYYLGVSYGKGEGVAQSFTESAKYYALACDRGWGEACVALAEQYANGQGVKADPTKARELGHRACEMHIAEACLKDP